jgi:hypothetical protein
MKLSRNQIELVEIDTNVNMAYFTILGEGLEFQVEFDIEYKDLIGDSTTGVPSGLECVYFNAIWLSSVFNEANEKVAEITELNEYDIQYHVEKYLDSNNLKNKYEI